MKNFSIMLILTLTLALTGCASWYMPAQTEDGQDVYSYETVKQDPETGKSEVVTVYTVSPTNPETGEELELVRTDTLKPGFGIFAGIGSMIASLFPATAPFAPLIPEAVTLLGAAGLAIRGRRKLDLSKAKGEDMAKLNRIFIQGFNKLKALADNGTLTLEELKAVLKEQAKEFGDPELLDDLVDIAVSVLPKTEKAKKMDEALEAFKKKSK